MEKCSICGREFSRLVNKNMHEKYCKGKKNENNPITNKKTNNTNKECNECKHDFILLDERFSTHRQAISHGYNAYCSKCKELT